MKTLAAIAILLVTGAALAEQTTPDTNSSTMSLSTGAQKSSTKKDIDEEITNAKLRAATGSKKDISISSNFNYTGGALTSPLSTKRPQLNAGTAADPTHIDGQIAVKWRATDHDNLSLGFGMSFVPAHTNKKTGLEDPASTTASTPYLDYSRVFKAGGLQNVLEATVSKYTAKEDVEGSKMNSNISLSHTMMGSVLTPALEMGLATSLSQDIYTEYVEGASVYQFALNPILEYAFNDKVSFRTVYRAYTATSYTVAKNNYEISDTTESMGIGYGVTRDIYLYPNMQWKWNDMNIDHTTVGFTANINL